MPDGQAQARQLGREWSLTCLVSSEVMARRTSSSEGTNRRCRADLLSQSLSKSFAICLLAWSLCSAAGAHHPHHRSTHYCTKQRRHIGCSCAVRFALLHRTHHRPSSPDRASISTSNFRQSDARHSLPALSLPSFASAAFGIQRYYPHVRAQANIRQTSPPRLSSIIAIQCYSRRGPASSATVRPSPPCIERDISGSSAWATALPKITARLRGKGMRNMLAQASPRRDLLQAQCLLRQPLSALLRRSTRDEAVAEAERISPFSAWGEIERRSRHQKGHGRRSKSGKHGRRRKSDRRE